MKAYHLLTDPNVSLAEMLADGYVSEQHHPTEPLVILNYTHAAQYDRVWNNITRQCRGLIVDDAGNVVARPWPKFYNYGEHEEGALDLDAPVDVTDKLDGSLGILYPTHQLRIPAPHVRPGWAIATRGSFTSEQALHATERLREKIAAGFIPSVIWTYLFEIIYPENRVVLDYGDMDELVLLDVLSTRAGLSVGTWGTGWDGPRARRYYHGTLRDALAAPPRANAEGLVVTYRDGLKVKIKQDDYVALHRLVTGLNERVVWEWIRDETLLVNKAKLPEEFWPWVDGVADVLFRRATRIGEAVRETYATIIGALSLESNGASHAKEAGAFRGRFAALAKCQPGVQSYLFLMLDGKDVSGAIWRDIRPRGDAKPRTFTEATA